MATSSLLSTGKSMIVLLTMLCFSSPLPLQESLGSGCDHQSSQCFGLYWRSSVCPIFPAFLWHSQVDLPYQHHCCVRFHFWPQTCCPHQQAIAYVVAPPSQQPIWGFTPSQNHFSTGEIPTTTTSPLYYPSFVGSPANECIWLWPLCYSLCKNVLLWSSCLHPTHPGNAIFCPSCQFHTLTLILPSPN